MSERVIEEVPVEYDDQGLSTGVEAEFAGPDEPIEVPFDPAKIDVQTRTMTVDLLMSRLRRGVLDLSPDFQRRAGIWSLGAQSRLIESLLLRIPLPVLYAAESGDESWVVIDGIQRLTTVASFVEPDAIGLAPLRLRGLEYLKHYEGSTYAELSGAMQTRINETELVTHLIRAGTPEPVMFNIFARINTGGRPLTQQELRHALIPGTARILLRDLAESEVFRMATQGSVKPDRMADRELVLRFLAFRMRDPAEYRRSELDVFLRDAMKQLNQKSPSEIDLLSADFKRAMQAAANIFGEHAFRKVFRGQNQRLPVNRALFDAESVNLAKLSTRQISRLRDRRGKVLDGLMNCLDDAKFVQSVSFATGFHEYVRIRFTGIENMLREVAGD